MVSNIPISICRPRRRRCHQDPVRIVCASCSLSFAEESDMWALTFAPAPHPERARKKKKVHVKDTHSDKINSESLIRWSEERPATRASLAPSGKIHKTILTISNRALHLIKKIARGAVKRESPDGPDSVQRENVVDLHGSKQRSRVFAVVEEDVCMCTGKKKRHNAIHTLPFTNAMYSFKCLRRAMTRPK